MTDTVKYMLDESDIPKAWYNIAADLPVPLAPPLHPGTGKPIGPDDLAPLFPMSLIAQEVSADRWIEIPEPVRDVYRLWRTTPLYRARRLEQALGTPAKIYYKYEGVSPSGSHKPNTAVAAGVLQQGSGRQAHHHRDRRRPVGLGAGLCRRAVSASRSRSSWCEVSFDQKPYRKALMQVYGAECVASPSNETESGRAILAEYPEQPGQPGHRHQRGRRESRLSDADTKYALGSVLNHVLTHQTVIGLEALKQLELAGDYPDMIVGCTGGGSNFAGLAFPFLGRAAARWKKVRVVAVEPAACPTLTRGKYAYDFGDTGHLTPLVKMHTLGSTFVPPGFHAGGLRYHGMAPMVSHLQELGLIESRAYHQKRVLRGGPAVRAHRGHPAGARGDPRHRGAIDEALAARKRASRASSCSTCAATVTST